MGWQIKAESMRYIAEHPEISFTWVDTVLMWLPVIAAVLIIVGYVTHHIIMINKDECRIDNAK